MEKQMTEKRQSAFTKRIGNTDFKVRVHFAENTTDALEDKLTTRGFKEDGTWAAKEKKTYALDENGERIPVIDPATGLQKVGKRNEKIWQRVTVLAND